MKANANAQFWIDMSDETKTMNVNGNPMPFGYWNLILSIRDVSLYSKGIKPHRNWRIGDVKMYFGIKGNAVELHRQLTEFKDDILNSYSKAI